MLRPRHMIALCLILALPLTTLLAGSAVAAESPVLAQCAKTGTVSTTAFTATQLNYALGHLSVDSSAYGPCQNAIQRALDAVLGKTGKHSTSVSETSSGGSSFLPVWLIVVLVVVILGGGGATLAARRRHGDGDAPGET